MEIPRLSLEEFNLFSSLIQKISGIYLKDSKLTLLSNRLRKRIVEKNMKNFREYYEYLQKSRDQNEIDEMLNAVSTNETFFYRNINHYDAIMKTILPQMFEKKRTPVKIWSAGCSSGEEIYTMAILLSEKNWYQSSRVELLASDINHKVLEEAKTGIYDHKKIRNVPPEILHKYFKKTQKDQYQISRALIEPVKFNRLNLKSDNYPKEIDIVLFRNVMIYFCKEDQAEIIHKIYQSTSPGGYLIIGHSESLYFINDEYKYFNINQTPVYFKELVQNG